MNYMVTLVYLIWVYKKLVGNFGDLNGGYRRQSILMHWILIPFYLQNPNCLKLLKGGHEKQP
jgi:hypothetical protein